MKPDHSQGQPGLSGDETFREIARRRGVVFGCVPTHETGASQCSPRLMQRLGEAVEGEGFEVRRLPSGAGHDAMAMSRLTDIGMLFVHCKEISHHPADSMTAADADAAARVLHRFLACGFRPKVITHSGAK